MAAANFKGELPPAPVVPRQWIWIWRAWHRLSNDRPRYGGFGGDVPGDIPWSLVRLWAKDHDMSRAEFLFLDRCIQAMDEVYREHVRVQQAEMFKRQQAEAAVKRRA